jgi:serralysin
MATVGTIAQLAAYLTTGYWSYSGVAAHKWPTNTISVNLTDLTEAEKGLARAALKAWSEVANLTFVETTGAAKIVYKNDGNSAVTSASWSGGSMTGATISISSNWDGGSTAIYSYKFQTYLHETGHALGLGHQGPYNYTARYGVDNVFTNDSWQRSVMSYFSQTEAGGAPNSFAYAMTPQMADILAIQNLYGARTTRSGDTTYGFGSTAGEIFDFSKYWNAPALTIYDSGGVDLLDCSGYSADQVIDLWPGQFSSVGGKFENVGIYTTVTIENASGGSGNDTVDGNAAANRLYGMAGDDSLNGLGNADWLIGHDGNDGLSGGDGDDNLDGDNGDDSLYGGGDGDDLDGGTGNDWLYGGSGSDRLQGGDGNDNVDIGSGADEIFGGSGVDTLDWHQAGILTGEPIATALKVDLSLNRAELTFAGVVNPSQVFEIENVVGLFYYSNDITGDIHANEITGGTKSDRIDGGGGDDFVLAGFGADELIGGDGDDRLFGEADNDVVRGEAGNDQLNGGGGGADEIYGGEGNDVVDLDPADLAVDGGAGTDVLRLFSFLDIDLSAASQVAGSLGVVSNFEGVDFSRLSEAVVFSGNGVRNVLIGGAAGDKLLGLGADDKLLGGDGHDHELRGGGGADKVKGGKGADRLFGEGGADRLSGDGGADVLTGGRGRDTFVFSGRFGKDVIRDFQAGPGAGDRIEIAKSLCKNFVAVKSKAAVINGDVVIKVSGSDWITLEGVSKVSHLKSDDFLFA